MLGLALAVGIVTVEINLPAKVQSAGLLIPDWPPVLAHGDPASAITSRKADPILSEGALRRVRPITAAVQGNGLSVVVNDKGPVCVYAGSPLTRPVIENGAQI